MGEIDLRRDGRRVLLDVGGTRVLVLDAGQQVFELTPVK